MKTTIILISLTLSLMLNAQWETNYYVDDFGEKTNEKYLYQDVLGTFSNSVTVNSLCSFTLIDNVGIEPTFEVRIFPYNRNVREIWIKSSFQKCKIKKPNGDIVELKVFAFKKGVLYFQKEDYAKLKEVMGDSGEYAFYCNVKSDFSESSYNFKFNQ
jgi:hypothetical protein